MAPLRRRPDGARRECLLHRYAIAATALNSSTLLLCRRPMVLTLLLRSPAFCSALSADLLSSGRCCLYTGTCPRAPCIVCRVATRLCSSAAPGTPDKTIYKLKPLSSPKRNRFSRRLKSRLVPLDTPSKAIYVVVTSVVAIDCSCSRRAGSTSPGSIPG